MSSVAASELGAPLIDRTDSIEEEDYDDNDYDDDLRNTAISDAAHIGGTEEPYKTEDTGWCSCLRSPTNEPPTNAPSEPVSARFVKNEMFVDVAEVMAKPLATEKNTRTITVRLETVGEYQLMFSFVLLLGSVILPLVVLRAKEKINDDDEYEGVDSCKIPVDYDDDTSPPPDKEIANACVWESGARLYLSGGLALFGAWWCWEVVKYWGRKPLWLQHGAVLLFLVGQLLLEDPHSAWQVRFNERYSAFTVNGELQGTQPLGCACMSLAALLLVDHCVRAGRGAGSSGSGGVSTGSSGGGRLTLWRAAMLVLCALWPVAYYEIDSVHDFVDAVTPNAATSRPYLRSLVSYGFLLWCAAFASLLVYGAHRNVRSVSYTKHRYANLLVRIFLVPVVLDLALVTIWGKSFLVLYCSTLVLPLFLALAHLPPSTVRLNPVTRLRTDFLEHLNAQAEAAAAAAKATALKEEAERKWRLRRAAAAEAEEEEASGGARRVAGRQRWGQQQRRHHEQAASSLFANRDAANGSSLRPMVAMERTVGLVVAGVGRSVEAGKESVGHLVGTVGNLVGVDTNLGPQNFDDENGGGRGSEGRGNGFEAGRENQGNGGRSGGGGSDDNNNNNNNNNVGDNGDGDANEASVGWWGDFHGKTILTTSHLEGGSGSEAVDDEEMGTSNSDNSNATNNSNESTKRSEKPAFCLETALWAAQLSNLSYWDPPALMAPAAPAPMAAPAASSLLPPAMSVRAPGGEEEEEQEQEGGGFYSSVERAEDARAEKGSHAHATALDEENVLKVGGGGGESCAKAPTLPSSSSPSSSFQYSTDLEKPSSNGCGEMNASDVAGLERNGMRFLGCVYEESTQTMVHLYRSDNAVAAAHAAPSAPSGGVTEVAGLPAAREGGSDASEATTTRAATRAATTRAVTTLWVSFRGTAAASEISKDLNTKQAPLALRTPQQRRVQRQPHKEQAETAATATAQPPQHYSNTGGGDGDNDGGGDDDDGTGEEEGEEAREVCRSHTGFWRAYGSVREKLHALLAQEMANMGHEDNGHDDDCETTAAEEKRSKGVSPPLPLPRRCCLVFCGHSLGGALATLAALDMATALREGKLLGTPRSRTRTVDYDDYDDCGDHGGGRWAEETSVELRPSSPFFNGVPGDDDDGDDSDGDGGRGGVCDEQVAAAGVDGTATTATKGSTSVHNNQQKQKRKKEAVLKKRRSLVALVELYTFGSPRVGDLRFSLLVKKLVPYAWRLVFEGDIVTALPRAHCGPCSLCECVSPRCFCGNACGLLEFKHAGVPVFLGRKNESCGDVLVNPSGVERVAYLHWARSVASHALWRYIKALLVATARIPDLDGTFSSQAKHALTDSGRAAAAAADESHREGGGQNSNRSRSAAERRMGALYRPARHQQRQRGDGAREGGQRSGGNAEVPRASAAAAASLPQATSSALADNGTASATAPTSASPAAAAAADASGVSPLLANAKQLPLGQTQQPVVSPLFSIPQRP